MHIELNNMLSMLKKILKEKWRRREQQNGKMVWDGGREHASKVENQKRACINTVAVWLPYCSERKINRSVAPITNKRFEGI